MNSWPFLDFGVMTSSTASAISQILVVVLFAYLVELGALIRASPTRSDLREVRTKLEHRKVARGLMTVLFWVLVAANLGGFLLAVVGFLQAQLPLLAVLNGVHLSAHDASDTWARSAGSFGGLLVAILLAFFTTRTGGSE